MFLHCVIVLLIGSVLSVPVPLCKLGDEQCLKEHGQALYIKLLTGNSQLGTEELDPMFIDIMEGNLPTIHYKFYNTTLVGFKKCHLDSFGVNKAALTLNAKLSCPEFHLHGTYEMVGKLLGVVSTKGFGDYEINTREYGVQVSVTIEKVSRSGQDYFAVKSYDVSAEALSPVDLNFNNIYDGNKELADAAHKFAKENSIAVSNSLHHPAFILYFGKIFQNFDKIVGTVTADKLL